METIETVIASGKENCCGCGTCAAVCPVNAIEMIPGELGCLYPRVDKKRCTGCGKCFRSCALQQRTLRETPEHKVFAAAAGDLEMLRRSASGGVFAAVAREILSQGGAVFGCSLEMSEGVLTPMHICVENERDLEKLQGSKYVQSDLGNSFHQAKQLLEAGRLVLFSGTPCQIDALHHFLKGMDSRNLYTMDIICHGVPSAKLFRDYLRTFRHPVRSFSFRDKTFGWGLFGKYTCMAGGRIRENVFSPGVSSYDSFFLEAETYRESCYSCRYANLDRVGDLTIGDYWGFAREHPELLAEQGGPYEARRGISEVLVNTEKGEELLARFGSGLRLSRSGPEKIVRWNRQLSRPSVCSQKRKELIKQYELHGYSGIEKQFRKKLGLRYPARKAKEIYRNYVQKKV